MTMGLLFLTTLSLRTVRTRPERGVRSIEPELSIFSIRRPKPLRVHFYLETP